MGRGNSKSIGDIMAVMENGYECNKRLVKVVYIIATDSQTKMILTREQVCRVRGDNIQSFNINVLSSTNQLEALRRFSGWMADKQNETHEVPMMFNQWTEAMCQIDRAQKRWERLVGANEVKLGLYVETTHEEYEEPRRRVSILPKKGEKQFITLERIDREK